MLYDALLLVGVVAALVVLPHTLIGMASGWSAAPWLLWIHLIAVLAAYFIWFWSHGGQTLAMKTWKIRLVNIRGTRNDPDRRVSPMQALVRHALCWPSLFLLGVGLFWALLDRDRQFLHDRLAGTRLVMTA